jgi:hypothetical protein
MERYILRSRSRKKNNRGKRKIKKSRNGTKGTLLVKKNNSEFPNSTLITKILSLDERGFKLIKLKG